MRKIKIRDNLPSFALILVAVTGLYLLGATGTDKPKIDFTPSPQTATAAPFVPATPDTGTEGDQLDLNGTTILVGRIWAGNEPNPFLGDRTCAPIAYRNMSDSNIQLSQYDWQLQTPAGLILDAAVGGATKMLPWGTIAPRGAAEGHVCFATKFENRGRWTITYKPSAWSNDKLTWTNQ